MMTGLIVIPARFEASRFSGKLLSDLHGKPVIQHVYERAKLCKNTRVLIATDDERIRKVSQSFGAVVKMTSSTHQSGTERIIEAIKGEKEDLIINVQADEPLIHTSDLDDLILMMKDNPSVLIGTLAVPVTNKKDYENQHIVKVIMNEADVAVSFSRKPIPEDAWNDYKSEFVKPVWKHVGVYAYRREVLEKWNTMPITKLEEEEKLEQLRALLYGIEIKILKISRDTIGIDTPEDLDLVREFIAKKTKKMNRK